MVWICLCGNIPQRGSDAGSFGAGRDHLAKALRGAEAFTSAFFSTCVHPTCWSRRLDALSLRIALSCCTRVYAFFSCEVVMNEDGGGVKHRGSDVGDS